MENSLEKIKSEEEYIAAKEQLEAYVTKYDWISKAQNPLKEIKDEVDELSGKIDSDTLSDDELRNTWGRIQELKLTYADLVNGNYKPELLRNITALLLTIEQYEADIEERNVFGIAKGIVLGDEAVKEYIRKKYMFSMARVTGEVPGIVNMQLESMDEILEFISKNCDLVGIEIPKKEEHSLVPAPFAREEGTIAKKANELAKAFLSERGVDVSDEVNASLAPSSKEKVDDSKKTSNKNVNQSTNKVNNKRKSKAVQKEKDNEDMEIDE